MIYLAYIIFLISLILAFIAGTGVNDSYRKSNAITSMFSVAIFVGTGALYVAYLVGVGK